MKLIAKRNNINPECIYTVKIMETRKISNITKTHKRQQVLDFIPGILSVILLIVAAIKIIISVYFLVGCRNKLRYVTNAVGLHEAPCYHLVTPSYIGCAVIFITIFGICCLGKRITAALFFILAICGAGFGVYLYLCSNCSFNQTEINELLNMTIAECHTQNIEDKNEVTASWQLVKSKHMTCSNAADWIINTCGTAVSVAWRGNISKSEELSEVNMCSSSLYHDIHDTQNHYMQFVLAIILISSVYYLFVSVVLCYVHYAIMKLNQRLTQDGEALEELNAKPTQEDSIKNYPKKFKLKLKWHFPLFYPNSPMFIPPEEL